MERQQKASFPLFEIQTLDKQQQTINLVVSTSLSENTCLALIKADIMVKWQKDKTQCFHSLPRCKILLLPCLFCWCHLAVSAPAPVGGSCQRHATASCFLSEFISDRNRDSKKKDKEGLSFFIQTQRHDT